MKWGLRRPSPRKRIAARLSWKRFLRHSVGLRAPRGWGWLTNPKKAAYNRLYNRTTFGLGSFFKRSSRRKSSGCLVTLVALVAVAALFAGLFAAGSRHQQKGAAYVSTELARH